MPLEVGKTYKDRQGREVTILATDLDPISPSRVEGVQLTGAGSVLGRMRISNSGDILLLYDNKGKYKINSGYDLIIPARYVKLDDAINILATRYHSSKLIPELLNSLPLKEIEE